LFLFGPLGVPFWVSVALIILLILAYTLKGGIKTLIWTDTFQSLFLLGGVILTCFSIIQQLDLSFGEAVTTITNSEYAQVFNWDFKSKDNFFKQFISGIFIAIAMTGLDQNMMQKNLSCKTLPEAQKNIKWFSVIVVFVNVIFVSLGALIYIYANNKGIEIPKKTNLNENLDDKIKEILNNDLLETDFDTSLTELNGKYQEMFSNSDNKVKNNQKTEKLFKKFMDF
jgi:Na+/proline symporter